MPCRTKLKISCSQAACVLATIVFLSISVPGTKGVSAGSAGSTAKPKKEPKPFWPIKLRFRKPEPQRQKPCSTDPADNMCFVMPGMCNHGTCSTKKCTNEIVCKCNDGYAGVNCDKTISEVAENKVKVVNGKIQSTTTAPPPTKKFSSPHNGRLHANGNVDTSNIDNGHYSENGNGESRETSSQEQASKDNGHSSKTGKQKIHDANGQSNGNGETRGNGDSHGGHQNGNNGKDKKGPVDNGSRTTQRVPKATPSLVETTTIGLTKSLRSKGVTDNVINHSKIPATTTETVTDSSIEKDVLETPKTKPSPQSNQTPSAHLDLQTTVDPKSTTTMSELSTKAPPAQRFTNQSSSVTGTESTTAFSSENIGGSTPSTTLVVSVAATSTQRNNEHVSRIDNTTPTIRKETASEATHRKTTISNTRQEVELNTTETPKKKPTVSSQIGENNIPSTNATSDTKSHSKTESLRGTRVSKVKKTNREKTSKSPSQSKEITRQSHQNKAAKEILSTDDRTSKSYETVPQTREQQTTVKPSEKVVTEWSTYPTTLPEPNITQNSNTPIKSASGNFRKTTLTVSSGQATTRQPESIKEKKQTASPGATLKTSQQKTSQDIRVTTSTSNKQTTKTATETVSTNMSPKGKTTRVPSSTESTATILSSSNNVLIAGTTRGPASSAQAKQKSTNVLLQTKRVTKEPPPISTSSARVTAPTASTIKVPSTNRGPFPTVAPTKDRDTYRETITRTTVAAVTKIPNKTLQTPSAADVLSNRAKVSEAPVIAKDTSKNAEKDLGNVIVGQQFENKIKDSSYPTPVATKTDKDKLSKAPISNHGGVQSLAKNDMSNTVAREVTSGLKGGEKMETTSESVLNRHDYESSKRQVESAMAREEEVAYHRDESKQKSAKGIQSTNKDTDISAKSASSPEATFTTKTATGVANEQKSARADSPVSKLSSKGINGSNKLKGGVTATAAPRGKPTDPPKPVKKELNTSSRESKGMNFSEIVNKKPKEVVATAGSSLVPTKGPSTPTSSVTSTGAITTGLSANM